MNVRIKVDIMLIIVKIVVKSDLKSNSNGQKMIVKWCQGNAIKDNDLGICFEDYNHFEDVATTIKKTKPNSSRFLTCRGNFALFSCT